MEEVKFYRCRHCGNIVLLVKNGGGILVCCGEAMKRLEAGSSYGAYEKHIPVLSEKTKEGISVQVGSVIHPMTEAHYIEWIYVQTKKGGQFKYLKPGEEPSAKFSFVNDEVVAVYEYCNLHGLYVKNL